MEKIIEKLESLNVGGWDFLGDGIDEFQLQNLYEILKEMQEAGLLNLETNLGVENLKLIVSTWENLIYGE